LDKNLNQVNKKTSNEIATQIRTCTASYGTHQQDGIPLPQHATLLDAYKVLFLPLLPKTKKTAFQVLNLTIWTQNKAPNQTLLPLPIASAVRKQKRWNTFCMIAHIMPPKFGP
jgi:hypothetical protein